MSTVTVIDPAPVLSPARSHLLPAPDRALLQRAVVASALVGSALIHGSVAGDHFGEWLPAGVFFLGIQLVELLLALLAMYLWGRRVATFVVITGVGTVVVWLISRTTGMPIGPADFRVPEPVGLTDVICGVLELVSVAAAAPALLRSTKPAPGRAGLRGSSAAVGAALAAAVLTAWALAPTVTGGAEHHHHAPAASRP